MIDHAVKGPVVVDAHASGLHSATPQQWLDLVAAVVAEGATVIGFTECRIRVVGPGWKQYIPADQEHAAECSIAWDDRVWDLVDAGYTQVSDVEFRRGNGATRPGVWQTWVVLRHRRTGFLYARAVQHDPSSIERGDGFGAKIARNLSWRMAKRAGGRNLKRVAREHGARARTLSFDGNANVRRKAWRTRIMRLLAMHAARLLVAARATFRGRVIDVMVTTLRPLGRVRVLPLAPGFDHRTILARLRARPHHLPRETNPRLEETP